MQRTRLSTLVDTAGNRITEFTNNPWRRISLSIISLFFGFFIGAAVSTIAGQRSILDVMGAALLVLFSEIISSLFYTRRFFSRIQRTIWVDLLQFFKIGVVYSLFLEAFKLGS
ncbi:hypothetical protein C7H19_05390 [Aphanothece hegewaldii CCALA 016]|uniref:DUF565 domain-containing protein n=1 Tax=Aphanothece hegewaldii CCALA 016 TaxID=2107694 RepID=A0A2T1M156_9CHRO|nr:DUF565 domain-containing protein [Aphanothece hegewaldii]PSF38420.1 hypothetical protein C7H19_05390 [Aphanothece hegewaldii CCALA 016]